MLVGWLWLSGVFVLVMVMWGVWLVVIALFSSLVVVFVMFVVFGMGNSVGDVALLTSFSEWFWRRD